MDAWPALPACLAAGGDERTRLSPETGLNKYGCEPTPVAGLLDFASSTASVISPAAYAAAAALYARLTGEAPSAALYARELARVRETLADTLALPAGTAIVLAASGTDAHLLAGRLAAPGPGARIVGVDGGETGRGVPAALAGQHFAEIARGEPVRRGEAVAGPPAEVVTLALRDPDGRPCTADELFAAYAGPADEAASAGRAVLLAGVDVSKTGLVTPDLTPLRARWPGRVELLIDACQWRLSPAALRAYLDQGYVVAVSGSKFLGGPSFSAALLIPPPLAARWQARELPAGLAAYAHRAEFPADWASAAALPELADFGLLLRWEAALAELRALSAVPEARVAAILAAFGTAVTGRLEASPCFESLAIPAAPDRPSSLFSFLLRRPDGRYLAPAETTAAYRALQAGRPRVLLGQPVPAGRRADAPVDALRLSASARHVVAAAGEAGPHALVADALAAIDQLERLL